MSKNNSFIEQERFICAIGALQSVVAIPRADSHPSLRAGLRHHGGRIL